MHCRNIAALERARTDLMKSDIEIRNIDYKIQALERANAELNAVRSHHLNEYRALSFHLLLTLSHRQYCKVMRIR